jgi:hypothetical protein
MIKGGVKKCLIIGFSIIFRSQSLYADSGLGLDAIFGNIPNFLTPSLANAVAETFGLVFDHRPYEPATPLGTKMGVDVGLDVTLVQVPKTLTNALKDAGFNIVMPPILPNIREINLHKGVSERVDLGGSVFFLRGYSIWAVEMKVVLFQPEEGPTWAVRLSRTSVSIPVGTTDVGPSSVAVTLNTVTWTPELLISKQMEFADPYIGIGYQYATSTIDAQIVSGPALPGVQPVSGSGGGFLSFLGLSLKIPNFGLRLTLEGAYSLSGYNSLGTKIGLSF